MNTAPLDAIQINGAPGSQPQSSPGTCDPLLALTAAIGTDPLRARSQRLGTDPFAARAVSSQPDPLRARTRLLGGTG